MPTISESLLPRFNWFIVPQAASDENWNPTRVSAPGQDAANTRQSRPYYTVTLTNCLMNDAQEKAFADMKWWCRGVTPILVRVPIACEIGEVTGYDAVGDPIVIPSIIGAGTGEGQILNLRRTLTSPIDGSNIFHYVRKPHLDYPDMPNIAGHETSLGMDELKIYCDGDLLSRGDGTGDTWTCDRNTGVVTTGADGVKSATGGFYTVMLLPDETPRERSPQDGTLWRFSGGLTLWEPFNSAQY